MRNMTLAALAAAAALAMTLGAEASQKKKKFVFKPYYEYGYADTCWWEYADAPKYVFQKVKVVRDGKVFWKNVKKILYKPEPKYVCSYVY